VILAFLTVGILIVLALLKLPKKSVVSFGILFFFITFSIQSNLLFNIGTFMNERFMFVALLGFCIILGYYMSQYYHRFRKISVLFLIVLGLYSVKSFTRTLAWKDNFTLFTTDVLVSSNSAKVNVSAAEVIIKQTEQEKHADKSKQMFQQALEYLIKAQTIHPTYFGAYDLAGKAAFHLDDYMASFSYYKQCLKINPNAIVPLNNIHLVAQAALAKEQTDNAEEMVLWLIDFAPDSLQFQYEMALIYEKKKEFNKSLDVLHNIIESNPDYVKAWSKAGEIYGKYLQNINKSEMYLLEAWKLKPDDFGVNENLGIVYGMLNKFALSIEYFNNALQIDSSVARLHSNMSNTYALMGNTEKAVYHEKKAQKFQKKIL
jgi:tetratricopeptide (TPR) repeat protein